jgi:glycosyltransferase involved in cell wall biosynthesis
MLATGGSAQRPSEKNPDVRWIFSSSLTRGQLSEYGRERHAPPIGQARLCIVARQDPQKGAGVVIRALPLIAKRFPAARFDVVGDGPGLTEFKRAATELAVSERVTFHGKLGHGAVMNLLQQADIFCFPTGANDGFPKAVFEGLASGLPAVATRVSVLPMLLEKGGGVLIEERTPEAVAAAVEEILSSQKRYEAMSCQAIETAREFSLESWRDTIGGYLREAWGALRSGDGTQKMGAGSRESEVRGQVVRSPLSSVVRSP